jgi:hypothetical protein
VCKGRFAGARNPLYYSTSVTTTKVLTYRLEDCAFLWPVGPTVFPNNYGVVRIFQAAIPRRRYDDVFLAQNELEISDSRLEIRLSEVVIINSIRIKPRWLILTTSFRL